MILGSITLQHFIALYPQVCGMTGTAATQALEFEKIYGMQVETIPTNRPVIRADQPDEVFATKAEKEQAVLEEIRRAHATGRPVLVGTGSVEESERLSRMLGDVPHQVLNARNDELEAAIVARAGERGAVTISTNMAGRGTDIRLGEGVAELGGLYVIGTQKHESRRIDNQLRGRAGRQGDPGSSRFFVSLEDDLLVKYGDINPTWARIRIRFSAWWRVGIWTSGCFCNGTSCQWRGRGTTSMSTGRRCWRAGAECGSELADWLRCGRSTICGQTIWRGWRSSGRGFRGWIGE